MATGGYKEAGYEYVIIDDCWLEHQRDAHGRMVADRERFPSGMKALGQYIHQRGLKFGIYQDIGNETCGGYPGVLGHEQTDIDTFVEWEVDYLKLDGCNIALKDIPNSYPAFGALLNATGRPIVYSCSWPAYLEDAYIKPDYASIARHCNLWRNWDDIDDSLYSVDTITKWFGDNQARFATHSGPGRWNDPDMIIGGNFGLSLDQARVQMAVWSVLAAPLIISADLDTMRPEFKKILLNKKVIAVNQDPLGKQGLRIIEDKSVKCDVWSRELHDGSTALAVVSHRTDGTPYVFNYTVEQLGLSEQHQYVVEDLFDPVPDFTLPQGERLVTRVNPTGVKFYKLKKSTKTKTENDIEK